MARRRYQKGHLSLRGKRQKVWVAQWREDEIGLNGVVRRIRKKVVLGSQAKIPTKKLAQRELDRLLSDVNSLSYQPYISATLAEFAERWERDILPHLRRSTQAAESNRLQIHILPTLGALPMRDINTQTIQRLLISGKTTVLSSKSIRNVVATFRIMWKTAKAWGYVVGNPFEGLVLPEVGIQNQPFLTLEQMRLIIDNAQGPMKTFYWILAETGIRAGEVCGLPINNLLLDLPAIRITQKVWRGEIEHPKSVKGNRTCEISPQLAEHLKCFLETWVPNPKGLLFASKNGSPWDVDVVRSRKHYPLLDKLGIEQSGFHAFRHGNESLMGQGLVPMLIRQNRMGHSDPRTTMRYEHVISEDGRRFVEGLGKLLTEVIQ